MVVIFWCGLQASEPALGDTAPITVTLQAASVTTLDMTACVSNTSQTSLGVVLPLPGVVARNSVPCTIGFGSSNSTASLKVRQEDGIGSAMHASPTGAGDATWGASGYKSIAYTSDQEWAYDTATAPDGGMYLAGERCGGGCFATVAKIGANGSLDGTFNGNGVREFTENAAPDGVFTAITIQPDGKVLVSGYDSPGSNGYEFLMARFTTTGVLDTTFGPNGTGWFRPAGSANKDIYYDVAQQSDGRIIAFGSIGNGSSDFVNGVADRYLPDGQVDSSFGTNGRLTLNYATGGSANNAEFAKQFTVRPNDDSLDMLLTSDNASPDTLRVIHASKDGVIDGTFTIPQYSTTNDSWAWNTQSIARQPDGKLVIAYQDGVTNRFKISRIKADGTADLSFNASGTPGHVSISFGGGGPDIPSAVSVEAGGQLLIAGLLGNGAQIGAIRLNADGSIDTKFASSGYFRHVVNAGAGVGVRTTISHLGDGRLALISSTDPAGADPGDIATFVMDSPAVNDYGGVNTWASGNSAFGLCMNSLTGTGVSSAWTANASCPTTDGAWWRPVPAAAAVVGSLTTPRSTDGLASFTFGMHANAALKPGQYEARLTFEVSAP